MRSRGWSAALAIVGVAILLQPLTRAAGRIVAFRALDGRTLSAFVIDAGSRPSPAVVLVPMLGRPKDDWQAVAQSLADANITALAIDLPGQYGPTDRWSADIQAAVAYLVSRPEVRRDAIGVAGASLGANLAALAAAADPRIRSVALVSPSLDYRGVRIEAAMRQYGGRPALLMASLRDPYAARSARELAADPPGLRELRWSETPAHGTALLARDPDLVRQLVEWFQRTLG
jgi:dienelactone hydrolase